MAIDQSEPDPSESSSSPSAARTFAWAVVLLATILALLVYIPALPSGWRSLTHFSSIGDSASARAGKLTIDGCSRGRLVLNWSCTGSWVVNDQMAHHHPPIAHMTLMNDPHDQSVGTRLDVAPLAGTRQGYLWGHGAQARAIVLWIGVLLSLLALLLALMGWRRRWVVTPLIPLVAGAVILFGAANVLLPNTW